jgi:hypothetical protein
MMRAGDLARRVCTSNVDERLASLAGRAKAPVHTRLLQVYLHIQVVAYESPGVCRFVY